MSAGRSEGKRGLSLSLKQSTFLFFVKAGSVQARRAYPVLREASTAGG